MILYNNILLVEDDPDDQMLFIEVIKKINNRVKYTVAYDGQDALNKLKILKHLPDIIFLDINMPHMNGFEFLTRLKIEMSLNQIPVIVLSTSNNIAEKVYQLGAAGFLTKPTSISKLQLEIENVLKLIESN